MSVGAYIGIGITVFVVLIVLIDLLTMFIISKKWYFVCDTCGEIYQAKLKELLLCPNVLVSHYALKCHKCGAIGAHKVD